MVSNLFGMGANSRETMYAGTNTYIFFYLCLINDIYPVYNGDNTGVVKRFSD